MTSELAGLPRRLAAIAYDTLLLLAVMLLFTFALWALRGGREIEPGTIWFQLTLVALTMVFFCWFWTHGGQTLGMRAWRIEIQGADGGELSWRTAIGRFWLAWLSALPAGLGFWWSWIDKDRLCWHDRLTDTRLVRTSRTSESRT